MKGRRTVGMAALTKQNGTFIHNDLGVELTGKKFYCVKALFDNTIISSLKNEDGKEVVTDYIQDTGEGVGKDGEIWVNARDGHFTAITVNSAGTAVELWLDQ